MHIQEKQGVYFVSGDINEDSNLNTYNLPSGKIRLDLSDLKSINSIGIRMWINGLEKFNITPIYINCPHFFVSLLNMVRELFENKALIESFKIPVYCPACRENSDLTLRSGIDFSPGKVFSYTFPKCKNDESTLESIVDIDTDFYFIQELKP